MKVNQDTGDIITAAGRKGSGTQCLVTIVYVFRFQNSVYGLFRDLTV